MTDPGRKSPRPVLLYICTTFPRLSETFLQREVSVLREKFHLNLLSLWKGKKEFEGLAVRRFSLLELWQLLYWVPYWLLRRPAAMHEILSAIAQHPPRNWLNWQETLLGLGAGMVRAREIEQNPPHAVHAVWATMPATFAWTLFQLVDAPFSLGAHAYDLYQDGGDCLLPLKIKSCRFIHTSTQGAASELQIRGCPLNKIHLIRRGLLEIAPKRIPRQPEPLKRIEIISVGRLVEKKGYLHQLEIYQQLSADGINFRARIVGEGPMETVLCRAIESLHLQEKVFLLGKKTPTEVASLLEACDVFVFTGVVAPNGDRDGLPNVIPEALAASLTVLARSAPGVREVIDPYHTGILFEDADPRIWSETLLDVWRNHSLRCKMAQEGRAWVEENFVAQKNSLQLAEILSPHPQSNCNCTHLIKEGPILIARTDRIGDVILTTSCLDALQSAFPQNRIDFFVQPFLKGLLSGDPVASVVPCSNPRSGKRLNVRRVCYWTSYLRKQNYSAAVFLHPDNDLQWAAALAGVPVRIGYQCQIGQWALTDTVKYRRHMGEKHETNYNFDLLQRLGCAKPSELQPRIYKTTRMEDWLGAYSTESPFAVFHPTAHGNKPKWPLAHFVELGKILAQKYGWHIRIIGADPDSEVRAAFQSLDSSRLQWVDHSGKADLEETAALLKAAKVVVGRDSGPAHLAAALDVPLVCLMGQCDPVHSPDRWRPVGQQVRTLIADLPTLPGERREQRWERCFASILPEQVEAVVDDLLSGSKND